jgi:uncharacterized protein (DUF433 family)
MLDSPAEIEVIAGRLSRLENDLRQLLSDLAGARVAPDCSEAAGDHPYVASVATILGGEPIIKGTRTPVRAVVEHWRFGDAPEEIARKLPHLRLAQIFDALGYYDDHRAEIERYVALNQIPVDD